MEIAFTVALIASLIAALMSLLVSYWQRLVKRKEILQQKELSDYFSKTPTDLQREYWSKIDADRIDYAIRDFRNYLVHFSTVQAEQNIEARISEEVDALKKRIEEIEARFPQEATLEKIASINDAILATKLETLANSIKTIQDKMLTKWDIAKTVFAILSALGILVGIIFGIISVIN